MKTPDVFFYEAFEEEAAAIAAALPETIRAGFTDQTIQEYDAPEPPARIISLRTQSQIPDDWSQKIDALLSRNTPFKKRNPLSSTGLNLSETSIINQRFAGETNSNGRAGTVEDVAAVPWFVFGFHCRREPRPRCPCPSFPVKNEPLRLRDHGSRLQFPKVWKRNFDRITRSTGLENESCYPAKTPVTLSAISQTPVLRRDG